MAKFVSDVLIVENKLLNADFCVIEVESAVSLPEFKPGQFVQVKVDNSPETFLRRPISIHDVNTAQNRFKMLIQTLGKGTQTLHNLKAGNYLNVIAPLGNGFSLPSIENEKKVILVGGGTGIAPLLFLGKYLKNNGFKPEFLLGFRNCERVILTDEYASIGTVHITTEDGSVGEKGVVTNHSIFGDKNIGMMYCCGPDAMMKAVAKHCINNNIDCEVSLENLMACGYGVCLCCVVDSVRGNICTCTEGPVFNVKELKW
jgi:dihydroorotate dehydrogenase electron transfer subunit